MAFTLIDGVVANDAFAPPAPPATTGYADAVNHHAFETPASPGVSSLVDGINNQQFATGRAATAQPVDGVLGLTTWTAGAAPPQIVFVGIPSTEAVGPPGFIWENQVIFTSTPGWVLRKKEALPPVTSLLVPQPEPLSAGLARTQGIIASIQADIAQYKAQALEQDYRRVATAQLANTQAQIAQMNTDLRNLYQVQAAIQQEIEDLDIMFVASILAAL